MATIVLLTATLGACAAKAQVRTEVELPLLDPPPPPPRVVTIYQDEPALVPVAPVVEAVPSRPPSRPQRADAKPESTAASEPEPVAEAVKPPAPSLTLSLSPGTEAKTAGAIRELMARASRDLARLNPATLNADGRGQADAARRFLQQAEDALKARNVVYAGKLADKAATIAAVLVR